MPVTIPIDEAAILSRLTSKWPVQFYSQYYKKFMFASADKDGGDNIVEFHETGTDDRNFFVPSLVGEKVFKFYSPYYKKYVFGSGASLNGNYMVELHENSEDRTSFQVEFVSEAVNTVRLKHQYSDQYLFASADLKAGDNVAELSNKGLVEDRQLLQLSFAKVSTQKITDMQYNLDSSKVLSLPPLVLTSNTVVNKTDAEVTKTSKFEYSITETKEWGNSTSVELGVKTEVSCGVPFIAEGKVEISATVNNTFNFGESSSTTKTFSEEVPIKVPAKSSIRVDMVAQQGSMDVPYTATVTMFFDDGTNISTKISDTYSGVSSYNTTTVFNKVEPLA